MKPISKPLDPDEDQPPIDPMGLGTHDPSPPPKPKPWQEFLAQGNSHRMYANKVVLEDGIHDARTMLSRLVKNQGSWDLVTVFEMAGGVRVAEHFNRMGKKVEQLQVALGFNIAEVTDPSELDGKYCRVILRRNLKGSAKYKITGVLPPEPVPQGVGGEQEEKASDE